MGLINYCKRFYKNCWKIGKRRRRRVTNSTITRNRNQSFDVCNDGKLGTEPYDAEEETRRVEIPEDVIVTLLLPKLPVKSLIRFKSVCKSWKSSISSREFAKSHLHYSSLNSRQYLERSGSYEWYSISCDGSTLKPAVLVGDRNLFPGYHVVKVVGCCNGLMCISLSKHGSYSKRYALWNPATHELRIIPLLPDQVFDSPYYSGFVYVPGLDDYIIFAALCKPYIFSLRTGCWSEVVKDKAPIDIDDDDDTGMTGVGVCVGDSMYWYHSDMSDSSSKLIFGFNFVTQEFETIPIPGWVYEYSDVELYVIQGRLSLHYRNRDDVAMWVTTQLGVSGSWKKSFRLSYPVLSMDFSIPGKCYVLDFDLKLKLLDCTPNIDVGGFGGIEMPGLPHGSTYYFPSLVSPFGDVNC